MSTALQYGLLRPENAISLPPMRAWQARAVPQIRESIREGHRHLVVMAPTGSGKTLLSAHLFFGAIAKGKKCLFVVPDITLVEQTLASFERVGIHDVGVIQAQHERTDWAAQVQIASMQTLIRRDLPEADLVICDEAHCQFDKFNALLDGPLWESKVVIGLSATPWARGMGLHWSKLIIGATIKELIADGVLCTYTAFGPDEEVNRAAVKIVKGDFDEAQASAAMSDSRIVGDVVETWKKRWGQDRTFMYCVDRKHARVQQAKFEEAGIPFGYIDGTMSMDERRPIFRDFRSGKIKGISSVGCLARGVDEDVRYIIDAQLTNSEMVLVQKCGRGLRNNEPGKVLLIADHAGNQREYLFDDIHHEKLDCRAPGDRAKPFAQDKKPTKPRQCHICKAIIPYGRAKCVCGAVMPTTSKINHAPGELVEYTGKSKPSHEDKQQFYSEFLGIAQERGHSKGWAAYRYRAKFGVWPRGLVEVPSEPSIATRKFDQHERIKYVKRKQKEASRGQQAQPDMPVL